MDIIKTEEEVLRTIIDKDGDCVDVTLCNVCPFVTRCVNTAIRKARLLPKETRVRLAYEKLFNKLMENELEQ